MCRCPGIDYTLGGNSPDIVLDTIPSFSFSIDHWEFRTEMPILIVIWIWTHCENIVVNGDISDVYFAVTIVLEPNLMHPLAVPLMDALGRVQQSTHCW